MQLERGATPTILKDEKTMDKITITAAEHKAYVAAMAEVERLRVKLATCYELLHDHGVITSPEFQAAKEACK